MSTPRSVASSRPDAGQTAFADDVAYYLTQTPRQLPSRYFYDELGSSLFEAICRLPWYRITRTEQNLLRRHAGTIFSRLKPVSAVVELGPGSGEKLRTLMAAHSGRDVTVHLVDVSASALDKAARALAFSPSLIVRTHQTTYETGLAEVQRSADETGEMLAVFLGSNIGNFDPPGVEAFLRSIRAAVGAGGSPAGSARGALLLGTDLVKSERELLLAYDDPLGVTAAFNRNLLVRVNRELSGDFDVSQFAHRAVWNAAASRVEMHLVSTIRQRVRVPAAHIDITFEAGEPIWTESSYKFRSEELAPMLGHAGFRVIGQWEEDGFALTLAEAT